jgi:hypothetical protein
MIVKIEGTTIIFDLYEVLRGATPEQCNDIADALSLHDDVRKRVIDSIIDGETDLHSSNTWDATDAERKRILEAHAQMTDDRIRHLECGLRIAEASLLRRDEQAHRLWDIYHIAQRTGCLLAPEALYRVLTDHTHLDPDLPEPLL